MEYKRGEHHLVIVFVRYEETLFRVIKLHFKGLKQRVILRENSCTQIIFHVRMVVFEVI